MLIIVGWSVVSNPVQLYCKPNTPGFTRYMCKVKSYRHRDFQVPIVWEKVNFYSPYIVWEVIALISFSQSFFLWRLPILLQTAHASVLTTNNVLGQLRAKILRQYLERGQLLFTICSLRSASRVISFSQSQSKGSHPLKKSGILWKKIHKRGGGVNRISYLLFRTTHVPKIRSNFWIRIS